MRCRVRFFAFDFGFRNVLSHIRTVMDPVQVEARFDCQVNPTEVPTVYHTECPGFSDR